MNIPTKFDGTLCYICLDVFSSSDTDEMKRNAIVRDHERCHGWKHCCIHCCGPCVICDGAEGCDD